ncbi:MAG TPA: helix-turn-helix domain-containing protein [Pelobium sp.]|nr:helix-turn-helix domain-containing protein [Pelobium sp.]
MNWTILKTESDYNKAIGRLDAIFDVEPNSIDFAEAELLGLLINNYEDKHYPIATLEPIEAIKLKMEELGLKSKDLQPFIGSKSYVSSILSGKRDITLRIANILHHKLGIPTRVFFNAVV